MEIATNGYQNGTGIFIKPDRNSRRFELVEPVEVYDEVARIVQTEAAADIHLPILATGNDIREVVRFLKNKPTGVTFIEAMSAEPRRVFDARKIAAYEFWGVVERSGERIRLAGLGLKLAERIKPECEIHREILRSIPAYVGALRSSFNLGLDIITRVDVVKYWNDEHPELNLYRHDEKSLEAIGVSFFSVCHAAELGTLTIGKRGQPARLRIERDELVDFLENRPDDATSSPVRWPTQKKNHPTTSVARGENGRIYLATAQGARSDSLKHIETALELADFQEIVFGQMASGGDFVSQSELEAIHRCRAAVFLLDADDAVANKNGELELRGIRLAEISVAMAILEQRVVVLWDGLDAPPPASLLQTNLHILTGKKADWDSGVRLVKLLKILR